MYGRVFESMYEGSMVGAGPHVFAVWNYILAKNRKGVVELNPPLLGFILGCNPDVIEDAIRKLQSEDPDSRSDADGGRRLIKEGQFQYRMVNWLKYDEIRQEIDRREYNRNAQAKFREKNAAHPPEKESAKRFQKPTIQELMEVGLSQKEAEKFFNHYESNGWKVGKSHMQKWRAAAAGWITRSREYSGNAGATPSHKETIAERDKRILEEAVG